MIFILMLSSKISDGHKLKQWFREEKIVQYFWRHEVSKQAYRQQSKQFKKVVHELVSMDSPQVENTEGIRMTKKYLSFTQ